jgi:hypothetical protein
MALVKTTGILDLMAYWYGRLRLKTHHCDDDSGSFLSAQTTTALVVGDNNTWRLNHQVSSPG